MEMKKKFNVVNRELRIRNFELYNKILPAGDFKR